jgi:hypothetical protein
MAVHDSGMGKDVRIGTRDRLGGGGRHGGVEGAAGESAGGREDSDAGNFHLVLPSLLPWMIRRTENSTEADRRVSLNSKKDLRG